MVTLPPVTAWPALSLSSVHTSTRAFEPATRQTVCGVESVEVENTPEAALTVRFGCVHESVPSLQVSVVQALPSLHVLGVPPWQAPATQVSPVWQKSVSQAVPFGLGVGAQASVAS